MEASLIQVRACAGFGCFTRNLCQSQFRKQWGYAHLPRRHICNSMHLEGSNRHSPSLQVNSALNYSENKPNQHWDEQANSDMSAEVVNEKVDVDIPPKEEVSVAKKRAAKIHDFCLGIPFGGFVFCGGIIGYIFSRSLATLSTGLLFGGALLSLSCFSLKVWKRGLSSLPFILGQGGYDPVFKLHYLFYVLCFLVHSAIAAVLFWKHFQTYSLTKKIFPAGFFVLLSGAMFCFYSYVLLSGGNPPPKKLAGKTS